MILANDFKAQWAAIRQDVLAAVERTGASGWLILGQEVAAFEAALAAHWGLEHAIGCGNGMDAAEIGLRAAGLAPGDLVLTTPLSAYPTTLAIQRAGGVPVFLDVDESGLLDLPAAAALLAARPDIRWCMPVHLFGHCMDMAALRALTESTGVRVLEDCAQSIGASHRGVRCGTVGFAAMTSFYPTKNLGAMGDGGALLTNDAALAATARTLRDYGQSAKYEHTLTGLNSRLDELQAAILTDAQLPRLDAFTGRRREIAASYLAALTTPQVCPLPVPPGSESVWHLFPVAVEADRRADFLAHLRAAGVQAGIHYPKVIPDQPALAGHPVEIAAPLPVARRLAATEVSLPIHPFLSDAEVQAVIAACLTWPG